MAESGLEIDAVRTVGPRRHHAHVGQRPVVVEVGWDRSQLQVLLLLLMLLLLLLLQRRRGDGHRLTGIPMLVMLLLMMKLLLLLLMMSGVDAGGGAGMRERRRKRKATAGTRTSAAQNACGGPGKWGGGKGEGEELFGRRHHLVYSDNTQFPVRDIHLVSSQSP